MNSNSLSAITVDSRRLWLHRYTLFLVVWIVLLIFFGGQVKSTESGLSVPDWPNTYGHFMLTFPYEKWVGGIFWEHSHRLLAFMAGIFTAILTLWTLIVEKRRWVKNLSILSLVMVIVQAVLGGLTVHYLLPAWLSATHGTLAQIYLCTVVAMAIVTSVYWRDERVGTADSSSLRTLTLATTAVIFLQLVVGAIMRHSEAGLAIPDFPQMFGSWIPPLSDERLAFANSELLRMDILKSSFEEMTRWQMISHLLHRLWAVAVTGMIVWTAVRVYRNHRGNSLLFRPAMVLVALVVVQVTLGILTILTEKHFIITSMHVVTGAMTLATSFVLTVRARHVLRQPDRVAAAEIPIPERALSNEVAA